MRPDDEAPPPGERNEDPPDAAGRGEDAASGGLGAGEPGAASVGGAAGGGPPEDGFDAGAANPTPPDDAGGGMDPPRCDWFPDRPDRLGMRRNRRKVASRRSRRGESVWRETLEVELPPRLNLLSLGIGFVLGCVFCLVLMARGLLPGLPSRSDPAAPPAGSANVVVPAEGLRTGGKEGSPARPQMPEGADPGREDEAPRELPKTGEDGRGREDEAPRELPKTGEDGRGRGHEVPPEGRVLFVGLFC